MLRIDFLGQRQMADSDRDTQRIVVGVMIVLTIAIVAEIIVLLL